MDAGTPKTIPMYEGDNEGQNNLMSVKSLRKGRWENLGVMGIRNPFHIQTIISSPRLLRWLKHS